MSSPDILVSISVCGNSRAACRDAGSRVASRVEDPTMNYIVYYTKESNDEIKNILNSRAFYMGADNKLAYSADTEMLNYVIKSIHKASAKQ